MSSKKSWKDTIGYNDIIQMDGFFAAAHNNYGKTPLFGNKPGTNIAVNSRKDSISSQRHIDDVLGNIRKFKGTEAGFKGEDKEELWKFFFLEYTNTFFAVTEAMPQSVVTVYLGRQAIELGLKYILIKEGKKLEKTHSIYELAKYVIEDGETENYLSEIKEACYNFENYIEAGNVEYFRYPEYSGQQFWAGNMQDIEWLTYNLAIILIKIIHYAGLDEEL